MTVFVAVMVAVWRFVEVDVTVTVMSEVVQTAGSVTVSVWVRVVVLWRVDVLVTVTVLSSTGAAETVAARRPATAVSRVEERMMEIGRRTTEDGSERYLHSLYVRGAPYCVSLPDMV